MEEKARKVELPLYKIGRAAQLLGDVSRESVRKWVKQGRLVPTRVGGRVMFSSQALIDFLQRENSREEK